MKTTAENREAYRLALRQAKQIKTSMERKHPARKFHLWDRFNDASLYGPNWWIKLSVYTVHSNAFGNRRKKLLKSWSS